MTPVLTVFLQGLSLSAAAATELLGDAFGGRVVSDRLPAHNHLPSKQRQLCWVNRLDHVATSLPADPVGLCADVAAGVEVGIYSGERTLWARTVRTCHQLLEQKQVLWTFLEHPGYQLLGVNYVGGALI